MMHYYILNTRSLARMIYKRFFHISNKQQFDHNHYICFNNRLLQATKIKLNTQFLRRYHNVINLHRTSKWFGSILCRSAYIDNHDKESFFVRIVSGVFCSKCVFLPIALITSGKLFTNITQPGTTFQASVYKTAIYTIPFVAAITM